MPLRTLRSILLFSLFLLIQGCFTFRENDKKLYKTMEKENAFFDIKYLKEYSLRWLSYENEVKNAPILLFIHGAPGSSSSFLPYIKDDTLRKNFSILLIDRPGYGYSDYGSYHPIPEQFKAIDALIHEIGEGQKVYIVGHSFGGTIAGYTTIRDPDWLTGTIMIAPALDPDQEKYLWFGKLALYGSTRWMVSKSLRVAADEKYSHEQELRSFINEWGQIRTPILHIHGEKDGLVPFGNLSFSREKIPETWLKTKPFPKKGHLLPFTDKEKMVNEILTFTNQIEAEIK
jgi:pimeloyl-ACP methyl ester carboxylesterase